MENTNIIQEDARLIMLRALHDQVNDTLYSSYLDRVLRTFGIAKDRAWIHDEMRWLADRGAVTLIEAGSVLVATLTEKGARHVQREIAIEGVTRPSRRLGG